MPTITVTQLAQSLGVTPSAMKEYAEEKALLKRGTIELEITPRLINEIERFRPKTTDEHETFKPRGLARFVEHWDPIRQRAKRIQSAAPEGYLDTKEAAEEWGVTREFLNEACRIGDLDGVRVYSRGRFGYKWFVSPKSLERLAAMRNWRKRRPAGYISVQEVADRYGRHPDAISKLCRRGLLSAVKDGQAWMVKDDEDLAAYFAEDK